MLHALLHGKLDERIPEPQRLEDALTSTVFGTLLLVGRWEFLSQWLGGIVPGSGDVETACYFWPRLRFAEPDVAVRVGDQLYVIESKFASGRHDKGVGDIGSEEELAAADQLVRQWQSVRDLAQAEEFAGARGDRAALQKAARECSMTQVFLVDGRRIRRGARELEESRARIAASGGAPDARLRLRTWQDCYRRLACSSYRGQRWCEDLLAYLERCGLASYVGDWRVLKAAPSGASRVMRWRRVGATGGLRRAVEPAHEFGAQGLRRLHTAVASLGRQAQAGAPAPAAWVRASEWRCSARLRCWSPTVPKRGSGQHAQGMRSVLARVPMAHAKRLLGIRLATRKG